MLCSNGNTSGFDNDGDFNYEEGRENNDEQGSPAMVDTTEYFNYQSHMDKTRTKRWSKLETESFYEVCLFGTTYLYKDSEKSVFLLYGDW